MKNISQQVIYFINCKCPFVTYFKNIILDGDRVLTSTEVLLELIKTIWPLQEPYY